MASSRASSQRRATECSRSALGTQVDGSTDGTGGSSGPASLSRTRGSAPVISVATVRATGLIPPRSMRMRWSALTGVHGPTSPSGQVTRTSACSAGPRPKWVGPSWPEMWPPPTVTSRRWIPPSALISIQAPIASAFGPSSCNSTASQCPIGAGSVAVPTPALRQTSASSPRLTSTRSSRPSRLRSTRAAPRARASLARPAAGAISTKVPSVRCSIKLLGSWLAWSGSASRLPFET